MLEILATNRALESVVKQEENMLRVSVEKLPSYQLGMEFGIELGEARGEAKGELKVKQRSIEIAQALLEMIAEDGKIAELTQLSVEEVQALRQSKK